MSDSKGLLVLEIPKKVRFLRGFTLVEIMVSVLILGFGLTLVANSYIVALRGVNATANDIGALSLAKESMESLEISSLRDGASTAATQGVLKFSNKSYDYVQEITKIEQPEVLSEELLQACLTLSWREQNVAKNVVFSTYLPKPKQ